MLPTEFPKGYDTCGGYIQGIDFVCHGNLYEEVASVDGGICQTVAFRAEDERRLFAGFQALVTQVEGILYPLTTCYYGIIGDDDDSLDGEGSIGKQFLDWMLSEEGQRCMMTFDL